MRFVSFDPFRSMHLRDVVYVKPEELWSQRGLIERARCLLFPEYWQIGALVYGLGSRIFPSLASYHLGHDKIEMTRAFLTVCPEHVPQTLILPNTDAGRARVLDTLRLPFIAKTPRSAQGAGVFLIDSRAAFDAYAETHDVLYAQERLDAERDMRIVVIGREVVGAYWRRRAPGRIHDNVARGGEILLEPIPDAARDLVEQVARRLDVDHAGFDVMEHEGQPYLLEMNRLFGHSGLHRLGVDLSGKIQAYLDARCGPETVDPDPGDPALRHRRAS